MTSTTMPTTEGLETSREAMEREDDDDSTREEKGSSALSKVSRRSRGEVEEESTWEE